jgi:hypothetical protein
MREFILVVCMLMLAACSTHVQTVPVPSGTSTLGGTVDGVAYYLPKKFLKVTLTRRAVPADIVKTTAATLEEAKEKAKKAKENRDALKRAAAHAADVAKKAKPDGLAKANEQADLLRVEAELAEESYKEAQKRVTVAEAAAAVATADQGNINYEDDIVITVLPAVADTSQLYVAHLDHSVFAEDHLNISTTENGLLKTVGVASTDKTPEIVVDTAKVAIAAFKVAAGFPTLAPGTVRTMTYTKAEAALGVCEVKNATLVGKPFVYEKVFDPTDPEGNLKNLNDDLCGLATRFQIVVQPDGDNSQSSPHMKGVVNGLLYRRPIPYTVELKQEIVKKDGTSLLSTREATQVLLPNNGPLTVFSLETGRFVTTTYNMEFTDGLLTKGEIKRPSEALGFVQIPLNVLREVIALPTDLLQLKIDHSTKETQLLESWKKQIEAQEALRKAREEREKATAGAE